MKTILNISEGAAIALHAADLLLRGGALRSAQEMAGELGVPYNHLSKILQRLTRAGLVAPVRGPKGGFALSAAGKKAKVKDFLAAIDGRQARSACLMKAKVCGGRCCLLGNLLDETNRKFDAALERRISEFSKRG